MKTNELRIGNWIKYTYALSNDIEFCKVTGVKNDGRVYFFRSDGCKISLDVNEIEPIELTEEVLLKIGFEDRKGYFNYSRVFGDENNYCDSIHIYYCPMLKHFRFTHDKVKLDDLQIMDLYNIKYLHQLQNVYYLLTNEELKIDL